MADTTFLQADLQQREQTDRQINFWLVLLLSFLTLGLWGYYVIWQLVSRRDRHFRRVARLAEDATVYLRTRAQETGTDLGETLTRLEGAQRALRDSAAERGAAIWTVLCILTQGLGNLVLWYVLMSDFSKHEAQEAELVAALNQGFAVLGEQTSLRLEPQIPDRSYWLYLLFTLITFGLFWIYWYYCLLEDPNRHFRAQADWEAGLGLLAR